MISVIVCTYNADWEKTKNTLFSIIRQKNVIFEIIVTDDGSASNNFELIKDYFNTFDFQNFKLVENVENKGTVANIKEGLKVAKYEYVKTISPGDYLYDELTLSKFWKEIQNEKKEVYFGKAIYYENEKNNSIFYEGENPRDLNVYRTINQKKIKKNYLVRRDYILGANFIIKKSILALYLDKISHCVKYAEDCSVIYMIAEGLYPILVDENIIWYEYGTGISTSKQAKWTKILYEENKNVFFELLNKKLINKMQFKMWYSKSLVERLIFRFLLYPSYFFCKRNPPLNVHSDVEYLMLYKSITNKKDRNCYGD